MGKAVVKVCFENKVLDLLVVEGRTQPATPGLAVEKTTEPEGNPQGSHKADLLRGNPHRPQQPVQRRAVHHQGHVQQPSSISNPDARPRLFCLRSAPYTLWVRVEQALEKLQTEGIIEPVEFSEWAAQIVPVVNRDGTFRVCRDYKLTVNQAAQVDVYPLPLVDDLFASLVGGKFFTKLEIAQRTNNFYSMMILDVTSRLKPHKGLFHYT